MRLAEIPEEQVEALLALFKANGKQPTRDGILRAVGKLSPDRPRPLERAQAEALRQLELADAHLERLQRELRETGSESELAHAKEVAAAILRAMHVLVVYRAARI